MPISIDMQVMRFLHKHSNINVVDNLDFITGKVCTVGPEDWAPLYRDLTELDMGLLYKNTTGEEPPYHGDALRALLAELAERFPVTAVDETELEKQCVYIEKNHPKGLTGFRYCKGSSVPSPLPQTLFPTVALPLLDGAAAVRKHAQRAATQAAARATTPAPTVDSAVKRAPKPVARPRSGVCKQIWEVLDAERAASGESPTRNRVKELAAQHGWNPNTASVQSAAWRKENNLP